MMRCTIRRRRFDSWDFQQRKGKVKKSTVSPKQAKTTAAITGKLEGHDFAKLFPLLQGDDFDELVTDIKVNGLQEPITKHEGKILDGLSRYRACEKAGVEPRFVDYKGNAPLAFVLSKNLRRRHLTADQRAVIAIGVLPFFEAEAKKRQKEHGGTAPGKSKTLPNGSSGSDGESVAQAAKATGAGINRVQLVKRIKDKNPKDFDAIKAGRLTSAQAEQKLRPGKPTKKEINAHSRRVVAAPATAGSATLDMVPDGSGTRRWTDEPKPSEIDVRTTNLNVATLQEI